MCFFKDTPWDWSKPLGVEPEFVTINMQAGIPSTGASQSQIQNNTLEFEIEASSLPEKSPTQVRYRAITNIYNTCSFALSVSDPTTFNKVVKCDKWKATMHEEMNFIYRNQT